MKWSEWRKWDLQVQTILDDWYISIDSYFDELKIKYPEKITLLVEKIGSEELIKKYDSKDYFFTDSTVTKKTKAKNYSKLLLNFSDIFVDNPWVIWITDHNYYDDFLIDELINESKNTITKVIPWVEVNIEWIHILVFFNKIPYSKSTYSDWIKTFLTNLNIYIPKKDWVLSVSTKGHIDFLKEVNEIEWVLIYPHCNSSNWLFQERTQTDRTHLANIFNYQKTNILQSQNIDSANSVTEYILTKSQNLNSSFVFTLCSDSRSLKDIFKADKDWNFTWIKSDLTFEWLKQIIYEKERVFIWENKPPENLHKISKIDLNFGDNIKIKKKEVNSREYDFCFSWVKETLYLSDYFNCFIWWRWSWKSSLLNIIYKKIENQDTNFFKENKLVNFDFEKINIDFSSEKLEFLGQNQIEDFATNYKEFSKAIYERLENQTKLLEEVKNIKDEILECDKVIKAIIEEDKNITELNESKKRLDSYNKVIDVIKWEEYKWFQEKLKIEQEKLNLLQKSKNSFNAIKNDFETFLTKYSKLEKEYNEYDKNYNEAINIFEEIKNNLSSKSFEIELEKEKNINDDLDKIKIELEKYLISKWISQEKLNDLNNAQEWIKKILLDIPTYEKNIKDYKEIISLFSPKIMSLNYITYKFQIQEWLKISQEKLKSIENQNILEIKFEVLLDENRAKEDLFEEFMNIFSDYKEPWLRTDFVKSKLFETNLTEVLEWTLNKETLLNSFWEWFNNNFLRKIFENDSNFEIYKILLAKYLYNLEEYLKINILYDNRPIESSSFWQRCTVVILIMLLFWTKPIIIDEPEAHLDSSLIADYLVSIIKDRKKERQIIFATHNANFVINWDAEQIYILENENNKTSFIQTTIENLDNRLKLLKLEWWEEAFKSRWNKLIR